MPRILIQAGHLPPLQKGFEGGTGTYREVEYAVKVTNALAAILAKDARFTYQTIPGAVPFGITCDAFVSIHGDGSVSAASHGYCFGYPDHPINRRLADAVAAHVDRIPGAPDHRADNYTKNLSGYYAFRMVTTPGPEILYEGGFLTNTGERLWMFANISKIAAAVYRGLCDFYGITPNDETQLIKRRAALREWILKRRAAGMTWDVLKRTANWREYKRLGGK